MKYFDCFLLDDIELYISLRLFASEKVAFRCEKDISRVIEIIIWFEIGQVFTSAQNIILNNM